MKTKIIDYIGQKIGGVSSKKVVDQKKRKTRAIFEQQVYRVREDLSNLEDAISVAENRENFNREDLHRIYRLVIEDTAVYSNWNTRLLKTIEKEYKVTDVAGNEIEEKTRVLEADWFMKFQKEVLDSKLWGFSLLEFGPSYNNGFVPWRNHKGIIRPSVGNVHRDHVKPEKGIITRLPGDIDGIDYMNDSQYKNWLMFVGHPSDHGLLRKIAKLVIIKNNLLENWSEWSEVFGMDMRIGRTTAEGPERNAFIKQLMKLGSSGYAVLDPSDEVEFTGTNRIDAYKVYDEYIKYIDEQIAKCIFGQDVVSNNTGRVVGSVGENIANLYGKSDAKFLQRCVNDQLIPFLSLHSIGGFSENDLFEYDATEKISLKERAENDLKIAQMGFRHSEKYINDTYGTDVQENSDYGTVDQIRNSLDKLYS